MTIITHGQFELTFAEQVMRMARPPARHATRAPAVLADALAVALGCRMAGRRAGGTPHQDGG